MSLLPSRDAACTEVPRRTAGAARRGLSVAAAALVAAGVLACFGGKKEEARRVEPPDPAQVLYAQGKYSEALPLLEQAAAARRTGSLLYQIGYSKGVVEKADGAKKQLWTEARPLLEQEVAQPGQATLDRLYYLTVICSDQGETEAMRKFGRQAIETIKDDTDPNAISGEDWFRLARIHEFLEQPSEAEAAYRRAVSAFHKVPASNPSYHALALARVGDLELDDHRFDAAVEAYDEALKVVPNLDQVRPYRHGLALFGSGRLDEAIAAFASDQSAQTNSESQYAADLARKAKEAGGLNVTDADGAPIARLPLEGLEGRIKEAAGEFRAARRKHAFRPGDPLSAEIADRQKRFVSLLRERLLQTGELQEFCLQEGMADLVRR